MAEIGRSQGHRSCLEGDVGTGASDRRAVLLLIAVLIGSTLLALLGTERFFLRDDLQDQYLGGYAEVARAWLAGEVPLLSELSWQSAALAGEYQYGVFSPFLTACNVLLFGAGLPLWMIAALLVLIHLIVLSCGAYVLARSEELTPPLAMMVALASSMNGWIVVWGVNWFPALASFAWVPWAWWALKRSIVAPKRKPRARTWWPVLAGIFVALIMTAGWPYTCLMIALIGAMLAARAVRRERSLTAPIGVVLGGLIGLGLSAPAWLMLAEYSGATLRGQTADPLAFQSDFLVPLRAFFAMIVPTVEAAWSTPWPPSGYESLVMHVGLAPVVLPITAMLVLRYAWAKERATDLMFLLLLCFLVISPSLGIFKWSFRWLPLLFLQLALVAGHAGQRLLDHDASRRDGAIRARHGAVGLMLILMIIGYQLLSTGPPPGDVLWLWLGLVATAVLWLVIESRPGWLGSRPYGAHRHLPWLAVLATSILSFTFALQRFPFDVWHRQMAARADPVFDADTTYLALYSKAQYSQTHHSRTPIEYPKQRYFPGNEHMHAGLRFVNGYSPMGPAGLTRLFGFNYSGALLTENAGLRPLGPALRRMAVDGLVTWPHSEVERVIPWEEFEHADVALGATIHRRKGGRTPRVQVVTRAMIAGFPETTQQRTSPWPLLETPERHLPRPPEEGNLPAKPPEIADFGSAELSAVDEGRLHFRVDVDGRQSVLPILVCFARAWLPGYRVELDGRRSEVKRLDRIQPAVEVPAGRKTRVVLTYRPASLLWGLSLTAVTMVGLLTAVAIASIRRRRHSREMG